MRKKISLAEKCIACMIAALTTIALLLHLGNSGTLPWFPPLLVFSLAGCCLLICGILPFVWHSKEKREGMASEKIYGILLAIIRYSIAFNLAIFGWKKLFGLQFVVPPAIAGIPMNQQSGEWLTWYYFGYSDIFSAAIAIFQLSAAYALLFRKTQLVAALLLFPFMLNLTMINIFYHLNAGALIQSILLTLGIILLVSLEYKRLVDFFFRIPASISSINITGKRSRNMLRFSAILLSLLFTLYLKSLTR
jgi:hypothetical protein